jgi:hypothetical protein
LLQNRLTKLQKRVTRYNRHRMGVAQRSELRYDMDDAFRTAKTTLPFKVLATLQDDPVDLARSTGENTNQITDALQIMSDWNDLLSHTSLRQQ